MAELSPVAASVQVITGTVDRTTDSGEAVDAGEVVYKKTSDSKWWLSQNDGTEAEAAVGGLAVSSAPGADQPLAVLLPASIQAQSVEAVVNLGVTLTLGLTYYLASTPGKVELVADVASGERVTTCLFAKDADQAIFQPVPTGALKP